MSEETTDTGTLLAGESRLRSVTLAVLAACTTIDIYLLAVSAGELAFIPWVLLALSCILIVGLNLRCLRTNGPTMGMMPVALGSLAPASLAGSHAFGSFTAPWWACVILSAVTSALCAFFAWWFHRLEGAYEHPVEPEQDAVLVVLGGLVRGGEPTPTVQQRLSVTAGLWREAPGRTIVTTGGPTPEGDTTEAEAMRQWLVDHEGIPAESILLEPRAINTTENIVYSLEAISEAGLSNRQCCIVTSDYHLYRALIVARRAGCDAVGVPAPTPSGSALQQWCREVIVILAKGLC